MTRSYSGALHCLALGLQLLVFVLASLSGKASSVSVEWKGWDAAVFVLLAEPQVSTRVQPLGTVFRSHADTASQLGLTQPYVRSAVAALTVRFHSHSDTWAAVGLMEPMIRTLAQPLVVLYVSHADAVMAIPLKRP